jgi:hypothetical protein
MTVSHKLIIAGLHATEPAKDRAEKVGLYGWLIGDWDMDGTVYLDDGTQIRWSVTEISPDSFRWLGERSRDGAIWDLQAELIAKRASGD